MGRFLNLFHGRLDSDLMNGTGRGISPLALTTLHERGVLTD